MSSNNGSDRIYFALQVMSISLIWLFVFGIAIWIFNLLFMAIKLNDMPNASVVISLVVIPIFVILAGTLTYVFVGLRKYANDPNESGTSKSGGAPK